MLKKGNISKQGNIFKKGDVFLVTFILLLALAGILLPEAFSRGANIRKVAVIRQGNKIIKEVDLDEIKGPERLEISGDYRVVILIEKGRIRFEESNCPDKVCVKTGWLEKPGDTAVCLPGRFMIKIEGKKDEVDGVTY